MFKKSTNESPMVRKVIPQVAKKSSLEVILPFVEKYKNSKGSTQPPSNDKGANTNLPCTSTGVNVL